MVTNQIEDPTVSARARDDASAPKRCVRGGQMAQDVGDVQPGAIDAAGALLDALAREAGEDDEADA